MRNAAFAAAVLVFGQGTALAQAAPESPPETIDEPSAGEPNAGSESAPISDPFEGFNRAVFAFNEGVDRALLEPLARGYRAATPKVLRTGVSNALHNLRSPVIFANDVLQGNPARAGTTAARFVLNSTLGVAGLLDVGARMGLERHDEDFGQTMAVWGIGPGPYLVLPLLGPSTLRDALGRPVDGAFDALTYVEGHDIDEIRGGRVAVQVVSTREELIEPVDTLRRTSIDPYVSLRSLYAVTRAGAIRNGADELDAPADFSESPE